MARKPKPDLSRSDEQLSLNFDDIIESAKVYSREEVAAKGQRAAGSQAYDPTKQTAVYMQRAVQFEEAWETTIRKARESLLEKDARELYLEFITDLKDQVELVPARSARLGSL